MFREATKTDSSRRVVSLSAFLANMLADHLHSLPADPETLLFTSPEGDGAPVRHELFVRRVFQPAVKGRPARPARKVRNGNGWRPIPATMTIPGALPAAKATVRWHDLRHTWAALLIAAGRHLLEIKTRLGHASISTTMDRYGQLFPSAETALADALDAVYEESNLIPLAA